jgi:hypothetical protein
MNLKYHIHESNIKCPYCDASCRDDDYSVGENFDNPIEFECLSCKKNFWAEANIVYTTYSDCSLNKIEHDFVSAGGEHPQVFNCENCSQYEVRTDQNKITFSDVKTALITTPPVSL